MSARERLLAILLGGFIFAGVVGLFAYLLVLSPLSDKSDAIEKLRAEVAEKNDKKRTIDAGSRRLVELKGMSLPPEPNTAQREYDFALTQLLNRAGIQAGSRTVNVKLPPDKSTIPTINPGAPSKEKKFAYQKVSADITMSRVNLPSLMKFLTSYYQLPLLQHISKMTVRLSETDAGGSSGRRGGANERNDLSVTLTTEAVILDGIEPRESLVRIPRPVSALGGAAAYHALDTNPDVGRSLALNRPAKPLPTESNPRDYSAMVYKDPFHGTMPPVLGGPPPERGLPSIAEDIRVSAWTTNSDGSAVVDITDMANNITYEIKLFRKGEKLHTVIKKQRVLNGLVVPFTLVPDTDIKSWVDKPFTISDATIATAATSSTVRTFTVHGLVSSFGVIVSSSGEDEKPAAEPQGGGRPGRGGFGGGGRGGFVAPSSGRGGLSAPTASAAVAGSAVTQKPEKYYVWSIGQPLSNLKEVPRDKVDDLLKNALAPLMPTPAATAPVASTAGDGR